MKSNFTGSSNGFIVALVIAALVAIFPPGSESVLCIAPGGHVAIEDIDAGCCAHNAIPALAARQQTEGLGSAGDCGDCEDLLLASNAQGTISESVNPIPSFFECSGNRVSPVAVFPTELEADSNSSIFAPIPSPSCTPLRC